MYGFLSLGRNLFNKYGKQLLNGATKTRLDALKTVSKKLAHKAAVAEGEQNRWKNFETKTRPWYKFKKCGRNSYFTRKKEKKCLMYWDKFYKMEHYKKSKLLNNSTISKSFLKTWIKKWYLIYQVVNILSTKISA